MIDVAALWHFFQGFTVAWLLRGMLADVRAMEARARLPITVMGQPLYEQRAWMGSTVAEAARGTQPDAGSIPARSTAQNVDGSVNETHTRPDRYTLNYLRLYIRNEYSNGRNIPREGVKLSYRDLSKYKISRKRADVLRDYVVQTVGYRDVNGTVYLAKSKALAFLERMAENE